MTLTPEIKTEIETLIGKHPILLFMKGDRSQPRCGFSSKVVEMLDSLVADYETVDVLSNTDIREGIKAYTEWPTIPQLYVKGEFMGGCDIITEMYENQELHGALGVTSNTSEKPTITISDAAKEQIQAALVDLEEDEVLKLGIDAKFEHSMTMAQKSKSDVALASNGITLYADPLSTSRANGLKIDFIKTERGEGFDIQNPNMPPPVKELDVATLKTWFESKKDFKLYDVRELPEWKEGNIEGAEFFQDVPLDVIKGLDRESPIVFQCLSGGRSMQMARRFRQKGFRNLYNLTGGINAWRAL